MYNIGIDLGGTNIAVGIVTKAGEVLKKTSVPARAERPFDQIFADMAACIRQLLDETGIKEAEIADLEALMADPDLYADSKRAADVQKAYQQAQSDLSMLYEEWEAAEAALQEEA